MKLVIRTIIFHILCIIIFGIIYFYLADSFEDVNKSRKNKTFIDYLSLSVTIQSGVGLTFLDPISLYSKMAILTQQMILISSHIITLYVFTL
jgi:asparagine N-glycosylation enzyme membrane subunit Stt3